MDIGKSYFIYIIKPTIMITTFLVNLEYGKKSEFPNEFYLILFYITFLIKPLFFLILYIGFLLTIEVKNFFTFFYTFIITISIYFGLPIKEFSDYLDINQLNIYFEGKEYNINEYILNHFIVNLLVENLPIIIFVFINNNTIGKFENTNIDPLVLNIFHIVLSLVNFILFFRKKFFF
jgi:hypothetical protein